MPATLQFLGAARTVTGSKFLLEVTADAGARPRRVLVDCGLFQGMKALRLRNWADFPVAPDSIDAVVLTHGHIDHCGYLPRLVSHGFAGPVFASPATCELLEIMLPDSAHLQEEEARFANLKRYTRHQPALPLYTTEDAARALERRRAVPYGRPTAIVPGVTATFHPAGHILGSAFVEIEADGKRVVFSGDLGGYGRTVMNPPAPLPPDVDYVLVESTYAGRGGDHAPIAEQLERAIAPVLARDGVVVIPAFAVGRTTIVLYFLNQLFRAKRLPEVPVFVDSPMATDAVDLYCRFGDEHNLKVDLLGTADCPIRTRTTRMVRTVEESKALNALRGPMVILSASGMATGGRVVHHLRRRLPYPENLVLLVGYQAAGTRGRRLLNGEPEVRMFGESVPVRAEIASIQGLSAHGDSDDLLRWLRTASRPPKCTFLVHGEAEGLAAMAERVGGELGFPHHTPDDQERVAL